jgi:hypothetical protein
MLYYLAHLVSTKNNINRRRRRFWHLMPKTKWIGQDANKQWMTVTYASPRPYAEGEAALGYANAKAEMKAMTPHMCEVRKEIGARTIWDSSGNIWAIKHEGKTYRAAEIEQMADWYLVEQAHLGKEEAA